MATWLKGWIVFIEYPKYKLKIEKNQSNQDVYFIGKERPDHNYKMPLISTHARKHRKPKPFQKHGLPIKST